MKYLALGDSYTIGEMIDYEFNFPNQVVTQLKAKSIAIELDKLIAVTGWTTDELAKEIYLENVSCDYDWVTLLIGVNNQYRGRTVEEYEWQFYSLLCQAILFAKGKPERVIVLSIPDWGLTPFNKEKDKTTVSAEIDSYNKANKQISLACGCHYVDITASTREHAENTTYLANDLLHYSAEEYKLWASKVVSIIAKK